MPVKKKKETPQVTDEVLALNAIRYKQCKDSIKELTEEIGKIRGILEPELESRGVEDTKGNKHLNLNHAGKTIDVVHTLRVGSVLIPKAEEVLQEAGLTECLETITVVRPDVLGNMVTNGEVSDEILKKLFEKTEQKAFSVKVK